MAVGVTTIMVEEDTFSSSSYDHLSNFDDLYDTLPLRPPETERQLEDYASTCASIQNILLALHSEGLGAKV